MDESRGDALRQIAFDDRLMGLDRSDARQEYRKVNNWEYSFEEQALAARAIIKIGRKVRLDALADAAESSVIPRTPES